MSGRAATQRAPRWFIGIAAALVYLVLWPGAAMAHASLVSSDPANGSTVTTAPATIEATFAEPFDTTRSSMQLLGPGGATLAANVPPTGPTAESMTISGFGVLAAGTYHVQWTTITPDDNGIERGTFSFTVTAVAASGVAASSGAEPTGTAAASPAPVGASGSGGVADLALPVVVLAAVVILGVAWFLRRSR